MPGAEYQADARPPFNLDAAPLVETCTQIEKLLSAGRDVVAVYPRAGTGDQVYAPITAARKDYSVVLAARLPKGSATMARMPSPVAPGPGSILEANQRKPVEWIEHELADRSVNLWIIEAGPSFSAELEVASRLPTLRSVVWAPTLLMTHYPGDKDLQRLKLAADLNEPSVMYVPAFRERLVLEVGRTGDDDQVRAVTARLASELPGPGLIVCPSARAAKEMMAVLMEAGVAASLYLGQLRLGERAAALAAFQNQRLPLLVTDETLPLQVLAKDTIRFVLHAGLPAELPRYYLEAALANGVSGGRAILLWSRADRRLRASRSVEPAVSLQDALRIIEILRPMTEPLGVSAVRDALDLPAKKARTILLTLEEAGLIFGQGRGFLLRKPAPELPQIEAALARSFEEARAQRRRQCDVINYIESKLCRTKVLWRYFGQEAVASCGICDNCRRGTEAKGRERARRVRTQMHDESAGVTHRRWLRGDLVRHDTWGEGEVKEVWGDKLRVHFPGRGEKILKADYVQPA